MHMSTLIDYRPAHIPFKSSLRLVFLMISRHRLLPSPLAVDNNNNKNDDDDDDERSVWLITGALNR